MLPTPPYSVFGQARNSKTLTHPIIKKLRNKVIWIATDFASLLTVGNTCAVLEPPAVIPVERSARLVVALGYKAPNDYARQSADSSGIRKQAATATGTLRWPYLSRRTSAMRSFSHAFSCSRDSTVRWSKSTSVVP